MKSSLLTMQTAPETELSLLSRSNQLTKQRFDP